MLDWNSSFFMEPYNVAMCTFLLENRLNRTLRFRFDLLDMYKMTL